MEKVKRLRLRLLPHHLAMARSLLELLFVVVIFTAQASAVIRFTNRSLLVYDLTPGATTTYTITLTYTTTTTVGSINILFCNDPVPTDPCVAPTGLDVSNAVLANQTGETGYNISLQTTNRIVLSRTPGVVGNTPSSYTFTGVINPTDMTRSYSARLSDYASTDASGPLIDLGSVVSYPNEGINLATQVAPILIFCVAQQVSQDCSSATGGNYSDMGTLSPTDTLTASSQMAAGTNASRGYAITANGTTMEAGTHVINAPDTPTLSAPGNSQFGINLVANSIPSVGDNPDGSFTNAQPTANYGTPNKFMYHDGDVVASAPNVSLVRRFTVSYIVNTPPDQRAGVYTTTITYICSGRF